jgi:hypothetical protein
MARGKIVCWRRTSAALRELVRDDDTGYLFAAGDPKRSRRACSMSRAGATNGRRCASGRTGSC